MPSRDIRRYTAMRNRATHLERKGSRAAAAALRVAMAFMALTWRIAHFSTVARKLSHRYK